jgi:hypothetical protein
LITFVFSCANPTLPSPEEIEFGRLAFEADGNVQALAVESSTNTLYVGGSFTSVSLNTGNGVLMNANTGDLFLPWFKIPKFNGSVSAVVPDGSGGWYVGGDFSKAGNQTRNRLAHLFI